MAPACAGAPPKAEFGYVDNGPDPVTNGWRRVVFGAAHPYIAAAQSMPFSGTGRDGEEYLTYQVKAFLDQVAGLDRLPTEASFADGLRNLTIQEAFVQAAVTGSAVEVGPRPR